MSICRIKQWQLTARHFGQVGLHHICTQLIKAKMSCNQLPMSYILIKINLQVIHNIAMSLYYIIYTIPLMLVAHWALLLSHCTSTSFEVTQKKKKTQVLLKMCMRIDCPTRKKATYQDNQNLTMQVNLTNHIFEELVYLMQTHWKPSQFVMVQHFTNAEGW